MSDPFQALFEHIYKGDKDAAQISFKLLDMAHVLDDLIDRDKQLEDNDIYRFAMNSLFEVHNHPYWNAMGLNHQILNVFLRWRDANTIESDKDASDNDLHKCYMLRAGIYDVFVVIAYYLHGELWAAEIGPMVRKFYGETLEDYIKEMRDA